MRVARVGACCALLFWPTYLRAQNSAQTSDADKAQTAPKQSQSPSPASAPKGGSANQADNPVSALVVVAKHPDYQRSADRRSYTLKADALSGTESVSDALRNIPTIDVDPQGQIGIRGNTNITILVDGQPAPLLNGPNRTDLMQQLPANQYERVEVIANPSAALQATGGGGIINLITKKASPAGYTTQINAAGDTRGGWHAGASGSYSKGAVSVSGGGGYWRRRLSLDELDSGTIQDPASLQSTAFDRLDQIATDYRSWNAYGQINDKLSAFDRLSSSFNYTGWGYDTAPGERYRTSAITGPLAEDYDSFGQSNSGGKYLGGSTNYTHQFGGDAHTLSLNAQYNVTNFASSNPAVILFTLPAQSSTYQNLAFAQQYDHAGIIANYKATLSASSRLEAGYELSYDSNSYNHLGQTGLTSAVAQRLAPATETFDFRQLIQDLYFTYQQDIGPFSIMPGLRLESVSINGRQQTEHLSNGSDYFEALPTLHLTYQATRDLRFLASYGRRIDRPDGQQFDPFLLYKGPLSFSQGNPDLQPAITTNVDGSVEYNTKGGYMSADVFYKNQDDTVSTLLEYIGSGATLQTVGNLGHTRSIGVQPVAKQQLTPDLSLTISATISRDQLSGFGTGLESEQHSGTVGRLKALFSWSPTGSDFLQAAWTQVSDQPTAQGQQGGYASINIGYRHRFSRRLSMELKAVDPFIDTKVRSAFQALDLYEIQNVDQHPRLVSVGLVYDFSGSLKSQHNDFDFSSGAPH